MRIQAPHSTPLILRTLPAWLVLALGLVLSGVAAGYVAETLYRQDEAQFKLEAREARLSLERHLERVILVLQAGSGIFDATDEVSATEFEQFYRRLDLDPSDTGILGIGWARRVQIPDGEDRYPIVRLLPTDKLNREAIGFDMYEDATRREAMEHAGLTGTASATRRVRLKQEEILPPEQRQFGFLVYVPVYSLRGVPTTEGDRRRLLRGFVYSPVRAGDLLYAALDADKLRQMRVSLYLGGGDPARELLHATTNETPPAQLPVTLREEINLIGRQWTLECSPRRAFIADSPRFLVWPVFLSGVAISGLLFAVIWTQAKARGEAERLAAELGQSEAGLRAADRAKDEFLAMLGHELRNPLAAVRNSLELISTAQPRSVVFWKALETARRQVRHQAQLVDDLLDVARVTHGKIRLIPRDLDLVKAVETALDTKRALGALEQHVLLFEKPGAPIWVRADPVRVEQVLTNLIGNAVKYTPPGGSVTVSVHAENGAALLSVRDTGQGIEPDLLPRLFDVFTQGPTVTDRSQGGLGLGLALTRSLVRLHGGEIEARSEGKGRGSEFLVSLPLTAAPPTSSATEPVLGTQRTALVRSSGSLAANSINGTGPNDLTPRDAPLVLVVDDNHDARETLRELMEIWGYSVSEAATGPEGLERIRENPPAVALVDIGLPGFDGYEIARQVRLDARLRDVFLVAVTGYTQPADRKRALEAGFDVHTAKPVEPEALRVLVRDAMQGTRTLADKR